MIRIGITGGMGAGKSVISEMMRCLGIPVYDADIASKKILNSNTKVKTQLIELLGEEIFSNGQLNRPLMAQLIFNNNELLLKTNAIIHPAVFEDFIAWSETQNKEVVACETAILFESGMVSYFDSILMVSAPLEITTFAPTEQRPAISAPSSISPERRVSLPIKNVGCSTVSLISTIAAALPMFIASSGVSSVFATPLAPSVPNNLPIKNPPIFKSDNGEQRSSRTFLFR